MSHKPIFCGIIMGFENPELANKLISMGFIPGKSLELIRSSFSTKYVKIDSEFFALRKVEFEGIIFQ
jgi:Fe2+ transport system protein FeoA